MIWKICCYYKKIIVVLLIVCMQLTIALFIFHPYTICWGANKTEVNAIMPGDDYSEVILSTRAITIPASKEKVWKHLTALGADRKGFYSYVFLEQLFGCKITTSNTQQPYTLEKGRLIPMQSADENGNYTVGFKVLQLEKNSFFVLEEWGSFLLKEIEADTRLIIRTHGKIAKNSIEKIGLSLFDLMHFTMEKRMLLGIKDIEKTAGETYTYTTDAIWLFSIVISIFLGFASCFIASSWHKFIVGGVIFTLIQFFVFVLNPTIELSLLLLSIVILLFYVSKKIKPIMTD